MLLIRDDIIQMLNCLRPPTSLRHDAASISTSASPPTLCDELFICLLLAAGCWLATEVTATPLLLLNQLNQFQAGNSSPGPCLATTGPAPLQLHTGPTTTQPSLNRYTQHRCTKISVGNQ